MTHPFFLTCIIDLFYSRILTPALLCIMLRVPLLVNTTMKCSMVFSKPLLQLLIRKSKVLACKISPMHLHGRNSAILHSFIVHVLIKLLANTCQCPVKETFGELIYLFLYFYEY